jgi:uncharacterized protein (DUF302 family)
MEEPMAYHISTILDNPDFATVRKMTQDALQTEGFGVLTEIDIKGVMKAKLGKDYPEFVILGACNPNYADKVLSVDHHMSAMLPCNVSIKRINENQIEVSAIDPVAAMAGMGNEEIKPLAEEVSNKLRNVIWALKQ